MDVLTIVKQITRQNLERTVGYYVQFQLSVSKLFDTDTKTQSDKQQDCGHQAIKSQLTSISSLSKSFELRTCNHLKRTGTIGDNGFHR